jgi:hypothetical protein
MDQRSTRLFVAIKALSAQAISIALVTVLGPDAITYSTLAKYRRQRQFPSVPCDPSEEPPRTVIDSAILNPLEKQPFSSIRQLAKLTCIPTTAVRQHLTRWLPFVVKHFLTA